MYVRSASTENRTPLLWEAAVAASYNREQICTALTETDENYSNFLDLESGTVVRINLSSPDDEELSNAIASGYGDRYRYIPGGNPGASDSDVQTWLDAEGL